MNQKGFTLIEVVVVIGIVGITTLITTTAFADTLFVYNRQSKELNLAAKGRESLLRMVEIIREGSSLATTSVGGAYTLGPNTLIVNVPSIDSNGRTQTISNAQLCTNRDEIIFYLDNIDDVADPTDDDDPTNPKLKLTVIPAGEILPCPASARQPITDQIIADHVDNITQGLPLFQDNLGGDPTSNTQTLVLRLALTDTYRGQTIKADLLNRTFVRNFGN